MENINNLERIDAVRKALTDSGVSEGSAATIEKALKKGMVFRKASDLKLLNLPAAEITNIGTAVGFGNAAPEPNVLTFNYTFVPVPDEDFYGYQFLVSYTNREGYSVTESYPIEDDRIVYVDLDLNGFATPSGLSYRVKTPQGDYANLAFSGEPKDDVIAPDNAKPASATIRVALVEAEFPPAGEINASYRVKGKLITSSGDRSDGYQIVLMAATAMLPDDGGPDFFPVTFATTETNGYFVSGLLIFNDPADIGKLVAAKSVVTKDGKSWEQPIALQTEPGDAPEAPAKHLIPRRLIIVIDGEESSAGTGEDDGECGCGDLNFEEKKTLEEYSYYTVVRTTEPAIIANTLEEEEEVDLDDIYGTDTGIRVPLSVFKKYQIAFNTQAVPRALAPAAAMADLAGAPAAVARLSEAPSQPAAATRDVSTLVGKALNQDLLHRVMIDWKISEQLKGKKKRQFKGRSYLTPLNQVDWDDDPTIYQAASVAHGHLLHFKQEWMPDGYSIGDLKYSLPLAPGQKKQIAVLDWERRESAANSQALDYEETLNNSLVRDRDINEVVNATLNENIKANSHASTGGIGFGLGSAVMGVFSGGTFGGLMGISGGTSSSGSNASQTSHRDTTASSLQSLSDRTSQAASSVRSQRATVIQTVSQGEQVSATSESVANYNHCHAVTIQYFEVLRHFAIHTRLADVQECLFIPLQITTFDLQKCLRWRSTLEKYLMRPDLMRGFDAILRILKEKENAENYYDSIGFPRDHYAEQPMKAFSGSLIIEFAFFNTEEGKVSQDLVDLLRAFGFGIDADAYKDRYLSNSELAEMVGPRAIEFLLNSMVIETDKGNDLKLDLTLLSRFRQNARLQVAIHQRADSPSWIPRDRVDGIKLRLDQSKLDDASKTAVKNFSNKFMKITVRSGSLRYRSDSMSQYLFNGTINDDLFADDDGVYIDTPLNGDELRNPRGEDVDAANKLVHHLNENLEHYHKAIWFDMTPERRYMLLDGIIAPGKAMGRSVASVVENRLIGIAGNSLIMPVAPGNQLDPTIDKDFNLFDRYFSEETDPMRVSLPTKGVYAESVMGKCNACEEKDESRFWRWEESPIPDSPSTPILPLDTGTRRADPGNLQPKDFPAPIVSIQTAPDAPDPTGLAAALQLIGKGDAFRDLTGLNQNQLNALATFQKVMDTAQNFGKEASSLAKAAAAMKLVEDGKKAGTVSNDDAKTQSKTILDDLQKDPNANRLDQAVGTIDKLQKDGKISKEDADAAKKALLDAFGDSSNAKAPMANQEIGKLADKSKETGKDISVKRADGESVDITNPGDDATVGPTSDASAVTLDVVATGLLKFLPTGETASVEPSIDQLKTIAEKGKWLPTHMRDYLTLVLGNRLIGIGFFKALLQYLAQAAAGTFRHVNIICYAPDPERLSFDRTFTFVEETGELRIEPPDANATPFTEVTWQQMIELTEMDSIDLSGITVPLSRIRESFTSDAEVRLWVMPDRATEMLAQTLANLFQVKVVAFTPSDIAFKAEVIDVGATNPTITKQIEATPKFSANPFPFDNFEQMVTEDAAKTGRIVRLPQKP